MVTESCFLVYIFNLFRGKKKKKKSFICFKMSRNKAVVTKLFCLLLEYVVGARCTSFQMQSQECDSVLTKCNHFHEKECFSCTDSLTSSSDLRSHCSNCQVLMDLMYFSTSKSDGYVHPQLNSYLLMVMTLYHH